MIPISESDDDDSALVEPVDKNKGATNKANEGEDYTKSIN